MVQQALASNSLVTLVSTGDYAIAIDPGRRFLQMTILGIWDRSTTETFARDVETALTTLRRAGVAWGTIRTMVDASTSQVMPQESVGVLQELTLRHGPASERIAILLHAVLQKLQLRRATPEGMLASFFDRAEALDWLFADR